MTVLTFQVEYGKATERNMDVELDIDLVFRLIVHLEELVETGVVWIASEEP